MQSLIRELSNKYNIESSDVKEIIEKTISETISQTFRTDAEFSINEGITVYGEKTKFKVPIERVKKNIVRLIFSRLEARLQVASTLYSYEVAKHLIRTVAGGMVSKVSNGSVYVDIESPQGTLILQGVCELSNQTPKERGKYKLGEYYHFFVSKVSLAKNGKLFHKEIALSRTSKSLVTGLLRKELLERFIDDIEVTCTKRIAGIYSEVLVTQKIPKECIVAVSKELKEKIVVKF